MSTLDLVLFITAFVFFVIAALPIDKRGIGFEWLAFAALVLTFVVP